MNSSWSYSPETPNLGQNRRLLGPCDLAIWRMTVKNNRASLLCYFKLCASFRSHRWFQTWVTVRKRSIFRSNSTIFRAVFIPEVLYQSFPSCTVCFFFLFTAPLTNDLFAQTEGHWGGDFAITGDIGAVNMTALDGAGGGWAAAAITLLSVCCNMILGHISSGFQPPLPSNDMKYLRCISFGSLNVICVYHCDLSISYACIILICNVIYMYPFDLWMLQLYRCITLICECYMNVSFDLWMSYHMCVLYSIHLCFTWQ